MRYEEVSGNLFDAPEDSYLVHCISADFALGAGIAVEFNKRFQERDLLKEKYPRFPLIYKKLCETGQTGTCIVEGRVCNLVTKEKYWHKPTMQSMMDALRILKKKVPKDAMLSMPTIGAGLDRLSWENVERAIKETFQDTDVRIVVYHYEKTKDYSHKEEELDER